MIEPSVDQQIEQDAETVATHWSALFKRLIANGFTRVESMRLLTTYITATCSGGDVYEWDSDEWDVDE